MRHRHIFLFSLFCLFLVGCNQPIIIEDFESDSFGEWTVEGEAFGEGPAAGTVWGQQEITGFEGNRFANSFHGGDVSKGSLHSPAFTIKRDYINFLIGGGVGAEVYIELLIEGKRIFVSRSTEESESLHWLSWDVKQYRGEKATIRIVDNLRGGWGHLLVDHIEMNNIPRSDKLIDYPLSFAIDRNFLLIPIQNSANEVELSLLVDNNPIMPPIRIRLAETEIDYWIPLPVEEYKGEMLTFLFNQIEISRVGLHEIRQSEVFDFPYEEPYRPLYHFSPYYGWTNDPNGLVWHDGEYHLFYQHNPFGAVWGNMSWGHAVSKDLIHWKHLPVALRPDKLGAIFSGSVVIDHTNCSGLGKEAMIAIYTSASNVQAQSLAYSLDNGRTFTKYSDNPILTDEEHVNFRDPKLFWHAKSNRWIMALATGNSITFYASVNLIDWKELSQFSREMENHHIPLWECPDLFPLKTPEGKEKWVLLVSVNPGGPNGGSGNLYFIGDFDGERFTADDLPYPLWLDWGRDNYASVSWNNLPQSDGRRIAIGWMTNWEYAMDMPYTHFANAMTLPRELGLKRSGNQLILTQRPIREVEKLRDTALSHPNQRVDRNEPSIEKLFAENDGVFELSMTLLPGNASQFGFGFTNSNGDYLNYSFNSDAKRLTVDRKGSGLTGFQTNYDAPIEAYLEPKKEYHIRMFFDKSSVELFINEGELVMTNLIFPTEVFNRMSFFSPRGRWTVKNIKVYPLVKN